MIQPIADLCGRILLAAIFLSSGVSKLSTYAATQGYMESQGVPGALLPAVIALETIAPLLLVLGWQTRLAALALAGFSLLTAVLFHWAPGDAMQQIAFMKNLAIAGGFLVVAAHGPGALSLDRRRGGNASA